MKASNYLLFFLSLAAFYSCNSSEPENRPNVVLIMADDMGYECLGAYGSDSYFTPVLDELAAKGILFENCISQPLCTPSRVKIMTGMYNYRNYEHFGYLNLSQYTFGNLMKDTGYRTCISGKWQLNGLAYKDSIVDWNDSSRPIKFGFEEYCLWQLTHTRKEGERFSDPLIEQNGEVLITGPDDYGPDIFADFILDFIERNREEPFFVYYPMVLVHDPFVPTPDSPEWSDSSNRYRNDTSYFRDMVAYTDKITGKILDKLRALDLDDNTIVIFTADNGTHVSIRSRLGGEIIQGGKGKTTDAGTHVPLIVSWPSQIRKGLQFNELIEFSDFYPTLADIAGVKADSDGKSFYPLLTGEKYQSRETVFVHYDPRWGMNVNRYRNQFARTLEYKLYPDGSFFRLEYDELEKHPLNPDSISGKALEVKSILEDEFGKHPGWK